MNSPCRFKLEPFAVAHNWESNWSQQHWRLPRDFGGAPDDEASGRVSSISTASTREFSPMAPLEYASKLPN
jgi:hypothetical protein